MAKLCVVFWLCLAWTDLINGHGFMRDPASRSVVMNPNEGNGTNCHNGVPNYTPQGNFCGGRGTQENNGGLCSACGDNYATSYPRPHDYGGQYATEITPTRIYLEGQDIEVVVKMTASHLGFFKFKLCTMLESDYPGEDVLTECFSAGGASILLVDNNGNNSFGGINHTGVYNYTLKLPTGVTCPGGCSLQWVYETANSPGLFPEHFINCADIRIVSCSQYTSGEYDMSYCGYGPTTQVYDCTGNTGGEGNDGEGNGGESNDGEGNGGEGYGGESNGGEGYGDSEGSESGGQNAGDDDCPNGDSGFPAGSCAACTNAQSPTCDNDCCSKETRDVYISSITDIPDMWCEENCRLSTSFCPAKWCCKTQAINWVDTCSAKKSLKTILGRLDEKYKKIKQMQKKKSQTIK